MRPLRMVVWCVGLLIAAAVTAKRSYMTDVIAENVWNKKISGAQFNIYAFDKAKVRIADSWISISDVERGGIVKFQVFFNASGTIDSLELVPKSLPTELQAFLPPKTISITVNSVPQGAELKIDGTPAGSTPKIVQVAPGKHVLSFSKEGFNPGTFPLETTRDDVMNSGHPVVTLSNLATALS